VSYRGP